jgi:TolA-binding protein
MSLAGVEKTKDACSTLQALKVKYPKASSTIKERANQEWKRLKCK